MFSNKEIKKDLIKIPALVEKPKGSRILVLAPHFDDETLGCGGTLLKHIKEGNKVSIVYITDSSRGISGKDELKTSEIRKKEAKNALNILGIKKTYLLCEKDGIEKIKKNSIVELNKIIHNEKPDLIYIPNFLENHVDHIKANRMLKMAAKNFKIKFNVCAYEVWTPIPFPNIIVNIDKEHAKKQKAISCFRSQLKEVDYLSAINGLNKYRSISIQKGKSYCEAFLFLSSKEYINRIK